MDTPEVAALREAATAFAAVSPGGLPGGHLLANLEGLVEIRDLLDGALASLVAAVDRAESTVAEHGLSTRGWLIGELRRSGREAGAWLSVARALPARPVLAAALDAGEVSLAHASLIVGALGRLPAEAAAVGEPILVEAAREASPTVVGKIAGELAARTGATEVAEAAARARHDARHVSLDRTFDGCWHLSGLLDPVAGEALAAALAPLTRPAGEDDRRSLGQRRADALSALAEHTLACGGLPDSGGERPQIMLTLPFTGLLQLARTSLSPDTAAGAGTPFQVSPATAALLTADAEDRAAGVATLGVTGARVAAREIRRLLCDAAILPAVLGGAGEVLDLGRARRTWSAAQRRAARLRDQGCTFPGCVQPLDGCDLHHLRFVADGGPTDLDNAAHLCAFHHRLVHTGQWRLHRNPTTGQLTATGPHGQTRQTKRRPRAG